MSVKIRCRRSGANNDPCFRIVATDSLAPRDGKCLEILGWYDPKRKAPNFYLKLDRVTAWVNNGALPSKLIHTLIGKAKAGRMASPTAPSAANPTPTRPAGTKAGPAAPQPASAPASSPA